jgi:drug/metabolite transporter (DMT)-like permease
MASRDEGPGAVGISKHDPAWLATACGVFSAVAYTLANICLRSLTHLDPAFVSMVKALPTVVVLAPLVALRAARGQRLMPSFSLLALVAVIAVVGQVGGNIGFQSSLGLVGLALAVPINLGVMILAGAILGHWLLGDQVSRSMVWASCVLVVAILVLSLGAPQANLRLHSGVNADRPPWWWSLAGVFISCVSGLAYSCLSVTLRYVTNRGAPIASVLLVIGTVGAVTLGAIAAARLGGLPWQSVSSRDMACLLGAGFSNVFAFIALTRALQLSSVMFVNALSASQTAFSALAGVLIFREPFTLALALGVGLTALGLLMTKGRKPQRPVEPGEPSEGAFVDRAERPAGGVE